MPPVIPDLQFENELFSIVIKDSKEEYVRTDTYCTLKLHHLLQYYMHC